MFGDCTADEGGDTQQREEVAGSKHAVHLLRMAIGDKRHCFRIEGGVGGELGKAALLRLPILVVGEGGFDSV